MTLEVIDPCVADHAPPEITSHNFSMGVLNGVFYLIGDTLMDPTLVIAVFLSQLTSNDLLIGFIIPIRDGLWALPQLWMSGYIQTLTHKINLYRNVAIIRIICWFFLTLEINLISDHSWLLISFMVTFTLACFTGGFGGLAFMEIVSKTIPSMRRGQFFAMRLGISGIINIGSSLFVRWVLSPQSPFSFPYNFGVLSILFFIFASTGLWIFTYVKEPADTNLLPSQPFSVLIKRSLDVLKEDIIYRNFTILLSVMSIAGMATPFFAIYVQQNLGGDPSMVGIYLGITIASNLAANLLFGRISRILGNRTVMIISILSGIGMSSLVLLLAFCAAPWHINSQNASLWLIPVFILYGFRGTGYTIASNCIMLDIAPTNERSLYVGLINTISGVIILGTGLSGVIKDILGIYILLILTLCAHLYCLFLAHHMRIKRSAH